MNKVLSTPMRKLALLGISGLVFTTLNAQAVSTYSLGEDDAGPPIGGSPLLGTTVDSTSGLNLTLTGAGNYDGVNVALGGSTLSSTFSGSTYYGAGAGAGTGGFTGGSFDINNFAFGVSARVTGLGPQGFSIAATMGSNRGSDGAGGNLFFYHLGVGSTWRVHSNGSGDQFDSGISVVAGQWFNLRYERVGGVQAFYVDGVSVGGPGGAAPALLKDAFSVGANMNDSGQGYEGAFVGQLDNAYISAVPEPTSLALAGIGLASMLIFRRRA